jgi:hypothetical protein
VTMKLTTHVSEIIEMKNLAALRGKRGRKILSRGGMAMGSVTSAPEYPHFPT